MDRGLITSSVHLRGMDGLASPEHVTDYHTPRRAEEPVRLTSAEGHEAPDGQALRLAENIVRRLDPRDEEDVTRIIHQRAVWAGGLMTGMALFWWLTVLRVVDGSSHPFLIDISFAAIAWWVGGLALIGTAFNAHSRLKGRPASGLAAGALFLLAAYFPLELTWWAIVGDAGTDNLWMALRLVVIGAGLHQAASLGTDAFLLHWVKRLMEGYSIELTPGEVPRAPQSEVTLGASESLLVADPA